MSLAELIKMQILIIVVIAALIVYMIADAKSIDDYVTSNHCFYIRSKFLKRVLFMRKTDEEYAKESVGFVITAYAFVLITIVANIVGAFIPKLITVITLGVIAGAELLTALVEATIRELRKKRFMQELNMKY